jgi:hypothetical protein
MKTNQLRAKHENSRMCDVSMRESMTPFSNLLFAHCYRKLIFFLVCLLSKQSMARYVLTLVSRFGVDWVEEGEQ